MTNPTVFFKLAWPPKVTSEVAPTHPSTMVLSLLKRFCDYVRYCYFHYTVVTTIAMLEPKERYAFNAVFLLFVSLFIYTTVIYLPGHLAMMLHFLLHVTGIAPYPTTSTTADS